MAEKLLTAKEVAERLQVSISWVLAHASGSRRPILPRVKFGFGKRAPVRFRPEDVEQFLEASGK